MNRIAEFLPILTTILACIFTWEIFRHYKVRKTKYLLWWTLGIINFGLGTLSESINILFGWSEFNLRFWYITGALLGGFTLAQGTVYLLMSNKFGDRSTIIWAVFIGVAMTCVILTPITLPEDFTGKLTGEVFEWQWVRLFSPFINTYAFIFSFGGAVYSANKYFQQINKEARFVGNIYISAGTLLPGIGGIYTKIGYVEVLFVTELVGLFLIYRGYRIIRSAEKVHAYDF
jgi:hypothetical protein